MNRIFKLSLLAFAASVSLTACAQKPADEVKASAQKYIDAVLSGNPGQVFGLLPASYKKDINTISIAAGAKADPEIWAAGTKLLGEAAAAAELKADLIAEMITQSSPVPEKPAQQVASEIRTAARAFGAASKAVTIDSLKAGDVAKIFAMPEVVKAGQSLSPLMSPFKKEMEGVKITAVTANDEGGYEVTCVKADGTNETEDWVKVDGTWVPEDISEDWSENIQEFLKQINKTKTTPEQKAQILGMTPMLSAAIKQICAATTVEQLQQAAGSLMLPVMMMNASMNPGEDID